MSLLATARKLKAMSADEVSVRIRSALRQRRERKAFGAMRAPASLPDASGLLQACAALVPGAPVEQLRNASLLPPAFRDHAAASVANASAILSGRWAMLGHEYRLGGGFDWHADPRTGHRFPSVFYADVPRHQTSGGPIDVKYVWELGRCQYVAELARGWAFSGNEAFARHAAELILSWIDQNPLHQGIHWTSGLEVAVRAISWIWTLATLAAWPGLAGETLQRIATSLADHARYLEAHFSHYSSPYNHLIGEATGLYWIAQVLPDAKGAAEWRSKARDVLSVHGPQQFYGDGFCVEQATGYHYFTLGFLTLALLAARAEQSPLEAVETCAHRAFAAGLAFRQPDGRWPAIGDVDSARALPIHAPDFWDFNGLCSLGAVLFQDSALKLAGSPPGPELFWLLGDEGLQAWSRLESTSPDGMTVLPESGYAIHRRNGDWALLDAGPIAHGLHSNGTPSTAHGHLDPLQALVCLAGQPVLVDPGMPFYFGDRDWVRHFRGRDAHNTIEFADLPYARDAGVLAWSHVNFQAFLTAQAHADRWEAIGRVEWPTGDSLERRLLASSSHGFWIIDTLRPTRRREVRWTWQFSGGCMLAPIERFETNPDSSQAALAVWCDVKDMELSPETAVDGAPRARQSTGYGQHAPAPRLIGRLYCDGPVRISTWVGVQFPGDLPPALEQSSASPASPLTNGPPRAAFTLTFAPGADFR
ncbi:MAG: heparinase II/III family protein [Planctomyces sp.]|nr:heparinase II/III family protein [Planctomyces sp.]